LGLIDTNSFWRQALKKGVPIIEPGKDERADEVPGIECDLLDYEVIYYLFTAGVLIPNFEDLPTGSKILYDAFRSYVKKKSAAQGLAAVEVTAIQKELRDYTNLGLEFVKKHLRILVDYEYVQLVGGKSHGTRWSYRLREDVPLDELRVIDVIPTPAEIKSILEKEGYKNL